MLKLLFFVSCLLISDISEVSSLQCYKCESCSTVDANTVVETCGATTTTTPGSTTTPSGVSTTTPNGGSTSTPTEGSSTTLSSSTQTISSTTTTAASSTQPLESSASGSPGVSTGANNPDSAALIESFDENSNVNSKDFQVIRARREISRDENTVDYVCVTFTHTENGTDLKTLGCYPKYGDTDVCPLIVNATGGAGVCTSCNTDRCNSAASLQISLFLLLIVTFARFALTK